MARSRSEGQGIAEYALILILIAFVCAAALGAIGPILVGAYNLVNAGF